MIGILGGMGPYATIAFYKKVLDLTNAKKDSEHVHVWMDINTEIPSRNRHFIFDEESPVVGMIESVNKMKSIGIQDVYIPCNSASYFIPEVEDGIEGVNITGTISTTIDYIKQNYKNKKVVVLGAHIVYNKEPYRKGLENAGFEYVKHDAEIQKDVEHLIYQIKTDYISDDLINEAKILYSNIITKYKIDLFVLGCTELCIVFDKFQQKEVTIIDTNYLLANFLVKNEKKNNLASIEYYKKIAANITDAKAVKLLPRNDNTYYDIEFTKKFSCSTLLDLGSGTGMIINKLTDYFEKITAVDVFEEFTQYISKNEKIEIICENLLTYKSNEKHELATMFGVAHYFNEKESLSMYENVFDMLTDNGIFILKNQFGFKKTKTVTHSKELGGKYFAQYRKLDYEIERLKSIGFKDVEVVDIYPPEANRWDDTHFYALVCYKQAKQ